MVTLHLLCNVLGFPPVVDWATGFCREEAGAFFGVDVLALGEDVAVVGRAVVRAWYPAWVVYCSG